MVNRVWHEGKNQLKRKAQALIGNWNYPRASASGKAPEWKGKDKGETLTEPGSIGVPARRN
jgi:hypothetical protein